jgi:hypothetical protein
MTRNVGSFDRIARLLAALPLVVCSAMAPFPLWMRLALFVPPALYLGGSSLAGTCLGYKLMGRSTCPAPRS